MLKGHNERAVEVFICYSHKDEQLREQLEVHLSGLTRQGKIRIWQDRRILAGAEWQGAIDEHIESARIILFLVSPDFLASDSAHVEVARALERHQAGEARVVPVILRPVDRSGLALDKLQVLPKDGRAVTSWSNPDEAFKDVARGIRRILEEEIDPPELGEGRKLTTAANPRLEGPPRERLNEVDGSMLVYAPGGQFTLGAADMTSEEKPVHRVTLTPFWVGKHPVTNAQYRSFLKESGAPSPRFWDDERFNQSQQPVVGVSWEEASAYCNWAGLELPTEARWEAVARGKERRRYPWGDDPPDVDRANSDRNLDRPSLVGSFPAGASPEGVLDLAGNVWEWCADVWDPEAYRQRDGKKNPSSNTGDMAARVIRGGSWRNRAKYLKASYRFWFLAPGRENFLGFRTSCQEDRWRS